jgi:hypothetical protein
MSGEQCRKNLLEEASASIIAKRLVIHLLFPELIKYTGEQLNKKGMPEDAIKNCRLDTA